MSITVEPRAPRFRIPDWIGRTTVTPLTAGAIAVLLLAAGLAFFVQIDRISRAEKLQQTTVQAQILASGIAAPLAFDDNNALQEYLNALRANPQIIAVGAYDQAGRYVSGYAIAPARLPPTGKVGAPIMSGRELVVTAAVTQGGTSLGSVYLRTSFDSWPRRATRYIGIAAIVIIAAALIAVLGVSYASLREAHLRLKEETENRLIAEEALRQSQKMEALGQLTGGVAHDFNNLLMVAAGSLDLMDRTRDPEKLEKLRGGIRQAVDRGAKLTQQLLTFARRSPLKSEVIDLSRRIRGMDALLDRLLSDGISMELQLPRTLWPVLVDGSQFDVAILNIALNARDAMPGGGVITITGENVPGRSDGGDLVRLSISDNGSGIAPEALDKIFEPFFTTKGVGRGTGLGLSQVYGFARASGGDVRVSSEVGKGTTLSLLLPRSLKAPEEVELPGAIISPDARRRILLVEDDDTVAEMVGGMLTEIGYDNERVPSGDAAVERLEQGIDFALVLSDMIMPGRLGGIDLAHKIAERWQPLPTMLMTGYSAAASAALGEGIPLLSKPFSIQALAAKIDSTLGRDRA